MLLTVHAPTHDYPIYMEPGLLRSVGELLPLKRRALVVTDSGVPKEYAETVAAACREARIVRIPQGEGSKTLDTFRLLLSEMLDAGLTRSDCVVSVGGGMTGDVSGFAAASYMRGVDLFHIPTTLLSQADSSIGGKTGVDFGGVKNSVGAFDPPKGVVIDPALLDSLPPRELSAGMAELIKMAVPATVSSSGISRNAATFPLPCRGFSSVPSASRSASWRRIRAKAACGGC